MKVLLFSMQKDTEGLGLKFIHYDLLAQGHDSSILFLPRFHLESVGRRQELKRFIDTHAPGLVGVSLMSQEYEKARILTRFLKEHVPSLPVIWGGIHPTIDPVSCLEEADYVCIGEGEQTMREVCALLDRNQPINGVGNLCYLEQGTLRRNPLYPLLADLDTLPSYEHVAQNSHILHRETIQPLTPQINRRYAPYLGRTYSVLSSRGCPFACSYCCNSLFNQLYQDNKIRRRSVEHVIQELERAIRDYPELKMINIQDDCFLAYNIKQVRQFFAEYNRRIGLPFIVHVIPTYLTEEKMAVLKESGLAWIVLGLQSGSDRVLRDVYQRKSYRRHFLQAATLVHHYQVAGIYDVIMDNPLENEEDTIATIETFMETPKPFMPEIFSLSLYPGTKIHDLAKLAAKTDAVEDYRKKSYLVYRKTVLNHLTRLAAFSSRSMVAPLLRLYRQSPNSWRFRVLLLAARALNLLLIEPITYFRMIKLSQGGSLSRALRTVPLYVKEGGQRFLDQF